MTYSVILFITRRPEYSPDEFKTYMEETHMPLVRKVMGDLYPVAYNRRYIERVGSGLANRPGVFAEANRNADPTAPVVLIGSPADVTWDMMGEMTFKDELHFQQCFAKLEMDGDQMREDEDKFTLPEAMKVIMVGSMQTG